MKAKTLCAAALATLFLGGTAASAAPMDSMSTNGNVTVENGKVDPSTGVTDPEKPDEKLPDLPGVIPNPNTDMGPLEISHAPQLDFGTVQTSTAAVQTTAAANTWTDAKDVEHNRGAVLQFGDLRTDANGYTVSAKLAKQFTKGVTTNVLNGSTITFTNPLAATATGSTGTTPSFIEQSAELSLGETVTVASANTSEKNGKGMWVVEYGSSEEISATDTTATSVLLDIPANTASSMAGGAYEAVIEWSISVTPGA